MTSDHIAERLRQLQAQDLPTHGGRTLAYVYDSGLGDVDEVGRQALAMFASSNGLDPTVFPSLLQMERDLVAFARSLVDGPDEAVGTVTSGGTESILLAVQAARDAAPHVQKAAMIVPSTIHAAFAKAAHYFGVEQIKVDVDPVTFKAVPDAMEAALMQHRERVVLMAASAPSYAHGVIDPIARLAAVAAHTQIRFHVDACIGGWVLPWAERAGLVPDPWDFRVEGVTSISVDLHKYAYTPKGASLLLHRSPELRRSQFFACADWPGYTMLNSTMQSTKSGGPLAAAWAVVHSIGHDGYARLAERSLRQTQELARGIDAVDGLQVMVRPEATLVAARSDDRCDVFTVADRMAEHGWYVQPQMSSTGSPASLHMSVSAATDVGAFLEALTESVAQAISSGPIQIPSQLADAVAAMDAGPIDDATFDALVSLAGLTGQDGHVAVPDQMAPINALLDAAPARLRETLLTAFLDRLTR